MLFGIIGSAVIKFERLFHTLLVHYFSAASVDYDELLKADMKDKELHKLTLGQILHCFRKLNDLLTNHLRLDDRELITRQDFKRLNMIVEMRNARAHGEMEDFSDDRWPSVPCPLPEPKREAGPPPLDAGLKRITAKLLFLIGEALDTPLFRLPLL